MAELDSTFLDIFGAVYVYTLGFEPKTDASSFYLKSRKLVCVCAICLSR